MANESADNAAQNIGKESGKKTGKQTGEKIGPVLLLGPPGAGKGTQVTACGRPAMAGNRQPR